MKLGRMLFLLLMKAMASEAGKKGSTGASENASGNDTGNKAYYPPFLWGCCFYGAVVMPLLLMIEIIL